ncbi:MAG: tetratricopeptide repeat protein [Bacteroidota bacterium]
MRNNAKKSNKNKSDTVSVKKSYSALISSIICFLFAFLLYANTLNHSYVLDDGGLISDNWVVTKGVQGIPIILKTTYWYGSNIVLNTYRPLTLIMFAIEWQLSPNNPFIGHFINVLFYAISCLLLFVVLRKYLSKTHSIIPLVITLLFAAHPIHTEVVANIKSRDEIMSFFFLMLTLLSLHHWFNKRKWWSLLLSLILYFLAFLSKEGVITMLFLFPIIGFYFTESKPKTIIIASLLLIIPAIAYILIRQQVITKAEPQFVMPITNFLVGATDFTSHFATAVMLLGKYLLLLIIPYQLVSDYSYNQIPIIGLSDPKFILSLLIYSAMGIYIILNFRKRKQEVFGLLFFLITISIYSNTLISIVASFGERLMFLPSLGFCISFVFLINRWLKVGVNNTQTGIEVLRSKPLFTLALLLILVIFSVKTIVRAGEWKNELTLFNNDIKRSPNSAQMYFYLGFANYDITEKDKEIKMNKNLNDSILHLAISHFEKGLNILIDKKPVNIDINYFDAIKKDPNIPVSYYNIGLCYYNLGEFQKAIAFYRKAISMDANYPNAHLNLGRILGETQRFEESIIEFKKCIQFDPENITAYHNIGLSYQNLNKPEEANVWFEKANMLEQKKRK